MFSAYPGLTPWANIFRPFGAVVMAIHSVCAGEANEYRQSPAREAAHHKQELLRAAELIRSNFQDIDVECFF